MRRRVPSMPLTALRTEGWTLQRPEVLQLLEKIRAAGRPLREVVGEKFYYGIKTGYNEAFVIDEAKRAELIAADPKSAEIIKPFLRGRDIKRWRVDWAGLYLIYVPWHFEIGGYSAVLKHLSRFRTQLEGRNASERGRYEWYALQRYAAEYAAEFEKPRIVYPDIYEHQSFAYDTSGALLANTLYFIPEGTKSMAAVLNSSLIEFYYKQVSA